MPPGTARLTLPDRYRVVRHIANGGMASVWEAHDELLDRPVAIKVLAAHLTEDDRARRRFAREARTAAGLSSHPHVVTIYDVAEYDGKSFIVMELLRGGTLADRLRDGEEIPSRVALRWLEEAGSALDAAHEEGVVHRDVKPANMLLDAKGRLAIADFGIARLGLEDQITQTGQVLGTAAYLSPEQAMGEPATPASDRYALAVVAFELLTGSKPFEAENFAAQARAHVEDEPPRASERDIDVPPAVDGVLDRGMAKHPAERWESAGAMVRALEDAVAARPQRRRAAPPTAPDAHDRCAARAPPRLGRGGAGGRRGAAAGGRGRLRAADEDDGGQTRPTIRRPSASPTAPARRTRRARRTPPRRRSRLRRRRPRPPPRPQRRSRPRRRRPRSRPSPRAGTAPATTRARCSSARSSSTTPATRRRRSRSPARRSTSARARTP